MGRELPEYPRVYLSGIFGKRIPIEYLDQLEGNIFLIEIHLSEHSVFLASSSGEGIEVKKLRSES